MAIGLATARITEKPPEFRRPCAVLSLLDALSLEPTANAIADTIAAAPGPLSAGCAPCDLPTTPPAAAVRLCSRRCGDGSARNAEAPPQRGVCGDGPRDAAVSDGPQTAPLPLRTAGTGAASPHEAGRQPAQPASKGKAEA